jgi:hypothetical protein
MCFLASNFADPVNGYASFIDVNSFIDWFLINEIAKNVMQGVFRVFTLPISPVKKLRWGPCGILILVLAT